MDRIDPLALDRDLRRTAERWRTWRRALRRGEGTGGDPFALTRSAVGKSMFQRVRDELGDADPLAAPMQRWIYRLAEQRINADTLVEIERRRRIETHPVDEPLEGHFTLASMVLFALGDAQRRSAWIERVVDHSEALTHTVTHLWERRREVAERMQVGDPDSIESPCPQIALVAQGWLARTRDAARDACSGDLERRLEIALATSATRGWPARLTLRAIAEWLNEGRLLDALRLETGDLPQALSGASYLRALARLGAAFVDATAPMRQPFVIAHDPYGLRRWRIGALFARLLVAGDFVRRRLELDRSQVADHCRAIACSLLVESRTAAARVLLRRAALDGAARLSETYEELTVELFGRALPVRAAGAILRIADDAPARFAGSLLSALDTERLVADHDEDWFRNPRAAEQLRAEAELSPSVTTTAEDLERGASLLERELYAALG